MGVKINRAIRSSKEFRDLINHVRAQYILAGKRPPTTANITKIIAKNMNKEELLRNVIIKF